MTKNKQRSLWGDCANSAWTYTLAFFISLTLCVPAYSRSDVNPQSAWKVIKGGTSSWNISHSRLDCEISQPGPHSVVSASPIEGDFTIKSELGPASGEGEGLIFDASQDLSSGYVLSPGFNVRLFKLTKGEPTQIASWPLGYDVPKGVHSVYILKKGATYRFTVADQVVDTFTDPGWDPKGKTPPHEPDGGYWGFAFSTKGNHIVSNFGVEKLPRAHLFANNPVLSSGPEGAWDQLDVFPAALTDRDGQFYLYYDGDYKGYPPSVGLEPLHRIGVATSSDLRHWKKFENNPIFGPPLTHPNVAEFFHLSPSNHYGTFQGGGGVIRLPNGDYGLTVNVSGDTQWYGVWLTESASLVGPFHLVQPGPVLTLGGPNEFDGQHIHLHCVFQEPDATYAMLYTGFNSKYANPKPGDHGGLATSTDAIHWTKYSHNPVFAPNSVGNWDDTHVRPKTAVWLGGWYYMFYEGAHHDINDFWPDQVGLARSRDLKHWERYPFNPIIPATAGNAFGNLANIQPAALVSDGKLYVFYGCLEQGHHFAVCGAEIPSELLSKWGTP